ncbi:MAG: hypothetical protein ABIY70_08630 [Capsulimonas sp.]|uniref:hypothetical protein n=1 Tax=Capsulimonas sp. TaxID=2494211 RepID=UPI0032669C72
MYSKGMFHSKVGLNTDERVSGKVREFIGDGSPHLLVAGLLAVLSVRIGTTNIPIERDYSFPHNADPLFNKKVEITLPQVALIPAEEAEGTAILMRSVHSNDGIWQPGVKIYVGGEWEDEASASEHPNDVSLVSVTKTASQPTPTGPAAAPANTPTNGGKAGGNKVVDEILKASIEEIRKQANEQGIEGAETLEARPLAVALARAAGYRVAD